MEVQRIDWSELYSDQVRPQVGKLLQTLRLDVVVESAQGDQLIVNDHGKHFPVIDFLGGYGSTILGHNPPELLESVRGFFDAKRPIQVQATVRQSACALAQALSSQFNKNYVTTFVSTGTEAVEAALKHSLMQWNEKREACIRKLFALTGSCSAEQVAEWEKTLRVLRPVVLALEGSFHGKTAGSLWVTSNEKFRSMYPAQGIETVFVSKSASEAEILDVWGHTDFEMQGLAFSRVIAVFLEPWQCEGGIRPLPESLILPLCAGAKTRGVPIVADEIQTGLFRTGEWLASPGLDIEPDAILLGKSLGGGISKIASFSIQKSMYQPEFGMVHSSTFSEDEFSSTMALQTLEILERSAQEIRSRAQQFEARVREKLEQLQKRYPGVIREVRGKGFLIGVEFCMGDDAEIPAVLAVLHQAGFASYVFASFLLRQHGVRVGVTLSAPGTLRIEPSAFISESNTEKLLSALEDLVVCLADRTLIRLTQHLWDHSPVTAEQLRQRSPVQKRLAVIPQKMPRVAFLTHIIDNKHLSQMDPLFESLSKMDQDRFLNKYGSISPGIRFHRQIVSDAQGREVLLSLYGVFIPSLEFKRSLRAQDFQAFTKVQSMIEFAQKDQTEYLGLGQYTSIVSDNGRMLRTAGMHLTTGSSLTAGMAFEGVIKALKDQGRKLEDVHVGVVGVTGNICQVLAQILGDHCREMTLVYREPFAVSPKFQTSVQAIGAATALDTKQIHPTHELQKLRQCDVIVIGTNSVEPIIQPELLKRGAIVLDISVPTNVDPRVRTERPDVWCFQGGYGVLPGGQFLETQWMPVKKGELFACMAETLTFAFEGMQRHASIGEIFKQGVYEMIERSKRCGIRLGSLNEI